MQHQHGATPRPRRSRAKLEGGDAAEAGCEAMPARLGKQVGGAFNGFPAANAEGFWAGRPSKQLEGDPAGKRRRHVFSGAEQRPDDLSREWCHIEDHPKWFKPEHYRSNMNKMQSLPWDNPRFRNWVAVARACHSVERALAAALQPLDLKPAQLDVLMNLYRHPGMSQHDLARKLLVGRSNITMLLPQLERRALVRRETDGKDRRVLRLFLTHSGEVLLMDALKVHMALIEKVMAASTPAECDLVGEQMRRIAEALRID